MKQYRPTIEQLKARYARDIVWRERLPICDLAEAKEIFELYPDAEFAERALGNPSVEVREEALKYLRQREGWGDSRSRAILAAWDAK